MGKTKESIEKFDEHLSFRLPEGYYSEIAEADDGSKQFQILAPAGKKSDGEDKAEFKAAIALMEKDGLCDSDGGIELIIPDRESQSVRF